MRGLGPGKAASCKALSQSAVKQGDTQLLIEGGGNAPPSTPTDQLGDDGGSDKRTSELFLGALSTMVVGILSAIILGIFHQCVFAVPAIQRDITDLKSGQTDLKSGQAELKLMIQRLCVAMEKPECALPPNACA